MDYNIHDCIKSIHNVVIVLSSLVKEGPWVVHLYLRGGGGGDI